MSFSSEEFQIELENYQIGIENILPAYLAESYTDRALADEMALVLHSRDWLEASLASAPRNAQQFLWTIEQLDHHFLMLKETIIQKLGALYPSFRQQMPRPRSHWWYYLDEIIVQPSTSPNGASTFLLPLTLPA